MFKDLYKKNIDHVELQQSRQRELLNAQKKRRENLQDEHRQLPEIFTNLTSKGSHNKRRKNKRKPRLFKDVYGMNLSLQLSEWLRQRPKDLCDWVLKPCPRGQRCMVVACNESTEVYNKAGRRFMTLRTQFPGDAVDRKSITLLDCIYSRSEDSFYVLDALGFGNQDLIECDAQFRFFWLRSKFEEYEDVVSQRTEGNEKPFHLLETIDFENATSVSVALQKYPHWSDNKPELDGFLFYHKEASYTCGTTPLVCWLFPFMVHDVLGLSVSESYPKPSDYQSPHQYMVAFDERMVLKKQRWKHKGQLESMDAERVEAETMQIEEDDEDNTLQALLDAERRLETGELDEEWEKLPDEM